MDGHSFLLRSIFPWDKLFKHAASVAAIILNGCDNECAPNTKESQRVLLPSIQMVFANMGQGSWQRNVSGRRKGKRINYDDCNCPWLGAMCFCNGENTDSRLILKSEEIN